MHLSDPLQFFFESVEFNLDIVERITYGSEYTYVLLKNGNSGVCANLGYSACRNLPKLKNPDFSNISHRIVLIAYLNALHNPQQKVGFGDIFKVLDFSNSQKNVMIGYFIPLVEKFDTSGIPLQVFDIAFEHARVTKTVFLKAILQDAETVIITSTSLMNNTLPVLLSKINPKAKKYLLGPSSVLHRGYGRFGINAVFGTFFGKNNIEVEQLIAQGLGSREFLKFSQKVVFSLT